MEPGERRVWGASIYLWNSCFLTHCFIDQCPVFVGNRNLSCLTGSVVHRTSGWFSRGVVGGHSVSGLRTLGDLRVSAFPARVRGTLPGALAWLGTFLSWTNDWDRPSHRRNNLGANGDADHFRSGERCVDRGTWFTT